MDASADRDISSNDAVTASAGEGRGKPARKGKGKPAVEGKGKRSLNLSIPVEDYERFAIHAMRANETISELFCKLGRQHLREFHITRTATRPTENKD